MAGASKSVFMASQMTLAAASQRIHSNILDSLNHVVTIAAVKYYTRITLKFDKSIVFRYNVHNSTLALRVVKREGVRRLQARGGSDCFSGRDRLCLAEATSQKSEHSR